jgi:NTE family protein
MSDNSYSHLTSDQVYTPKRETGFSSLEILSLPDHLRDLVNQVMRHEPISLQELIATIGRPADDVRGQIALLSAQGWLRTEEIDSQPHYYVNLARRRTRKLPPGIWQVLEGTWKTQLFRHFNQDEKINFSQSFELEHYKAQQTIYKEGEWGYTMYLIDSGVVELVSKDVDGNKVVLKRLRSGDILGEIAILLGERHWATARAAEPVTAWTLTKSDLDQLLSRSPAAGLSIRRMIEQGLRDEHTRISVNWKSKPGERHAGITTSTAKGIDKDSIETVLVVGSGANTLITALSKYSGKPILAIDLHASPSNEQVPQLPSVDVRQLHNMDSKSLRGILNTDAPPNGLVVLMTPAELHSPLMGIIDTIDLVIDLSAKELPWVIAAARRRWSLPSNVPFKIAVERLARRLAGRTVGLVLGGGAARTLAHIGVLRALEEAQIPVDMIASTGMGAVIGGLYAAGLSVNELTDLALRHERELSPFESSFNLRLASRSALFEGKRARNTLIKLAGNRTFADLELPLFVIVTDLNSGKPITIDEGPLVDALTASIALAGLVDPVEISHSPIPSLNGHTLTDGSLINPVPADTLFSQGAHIIIGASTIPSLHYTNTRSQERTDLLHTWLRLRDQLAYAALMDNLHYLDVLIVPSIDQFDGSEFDQAAELVAAGLSATQREIDYIRTLLAPDGDS